MNESIAKFVGGLIGVGDGGGGGVWGGGGGWGGGIFTGTSLVVPKKCLLSIHVRVPAAYVNLDYVQYFGKKT